jgi:hypothetical protein
MGADMEAKKVKDEVGRTLLLYTIKGGYEVVIKLLEKKTSFWL